MGRHSSSRKLPHLPSDLWSRAKSALFAVPRGMHLLLLIICLALGFALATQVRSQRSDPLDSLSQQDLVVLLSELDSQENALRQERAALQNQVSALKSAETEQEAAAEAARKADEQAQINAGTVAVHGPGILMRVTDSNGGLSATEFVMTLGELRNAGAEAIDLNGNRLSTRSAFVLTPEGISVDGSPIVSPYEWRVIGAPQTIASALEIQAGSAAQMRAKGAEVTISERDDIVIRSLATPLTPQYASVE